MKSLTLKGFKSFASATTLKFEPGICCVVGPNGSGKSNVVDALAWVMGEQGAKTLRGGKMEDVIFAGAGSRKALGRAEVTLTIDNSDQALPIDYSEVSITRRMFRDGASEYEINGSKARLMDIQELLSDSGIGREMHIIVGQGRLAEILQSRPEERRAYIEEAAGVLKHKRRKEKAQRKLVGMQANLDRLEDLTAELKKQLKPLARQAQAAQKAATVQAELREAKTNLAVDKLLHLTEESAAARRTASARAAELAQAEKDLAGLEAEEEDIATTLAEIIPRADASQKLWFDLSSLAERVSATARIAADRAKNQSEATAFTGEDPEELAARAAAADAELERLEEEVDIAAERLESIRDSVEAKKEAARNAEAELSRRLRAIADRREGVVRLLAAEESQRAQIARLEHDAETLATTVADFDERVRLTGLEAVTAADDLTQATRNREPLAERLRQATQEADEAEARLEQLREKEKDLERHVSRLSSRIDTLSSTMPKAPAAQVLAGIGDYRDLAGLMTVEDGYATACAAALGTHASALAGAIDIPELDGIDHTGIARTTVVATTSDTTGGRWRLDADLPAGAGWLLDHIDIDARISAPITRLLADVVVVDSPEIAQAVVAADPRLKAVDLSGTLRGHGWLEIGQGATNPVTTRAQIADAEKHLAQAEKELGTLSGTLEGAATAAGEARVNQASATAALREHDITVEQLTRDANRLSAQARATEAERDRAAQRRDSAGEQLEALRAELADTLDRLARADDPDQLDEPDTGDKERAQQELEQVTAMEVEARLALRTAEERAGQIKGRGDSLRRRAQAEAQAKARHDKAMEARKQYAAVAAAVHGHALKLGDRVADATARAATRRDRLAEEKKQASDSQARVKTAVGYKRQQLAGLTEAAHKADLAASAAAVRLEQAEQAVHSQMGIPPAALLDSHRLPEDFDREEEQQRLARAEKSLSSLGKVNPLALEEYKALEERYTFLAGQLADVEQARADLRGVIEEVDGKILTLFTDAWRDVEKEFPAVFETLFPGGTGRLVLTDPDDMLTTGIEVEARPPGKKVTRLTLLSGGEKSLTTLAMLVAIFKARPSPFYVLDEVEAALDDVNLRRLIALLKQLRHDSQLIVITHQKPTMEVANVLYGVTMRGDGVTRVISQRMNPPADETKDE
nr:chromosome segregation protein SMC [Corynebacterium mendelii]